MSRARGCFFFLLASLKNVLVWIKRMQIKPTFLTSCVKDADKEGVGYTCISRKVEGVLCCTKTGEIIPPSPHLNPTHPSPGFYSSDITSWIWGCTYIYIFPYWNYIYAIEFIRLKRKWIYRSKVVWLLHVFCMGVFLFH